VSVTHPNAFQSPTIVLEPSRTVFECFISQSWSDRPTKQLPDQISDDLGKSPDLYVFDQNYEHLALRRHRMLTPVTALPTIPRKGKPIISVSASFCINNVAGKMAEMIDFRLTIDQSPSSDRTRFNL
jgi:hypothetical protein